MNISPGPANSLRDMVKRARNELGTKGPAQISPLVRQLLALAPDDADVNALTARWYIMLNELDAAKPHLDKALAMASADPDTQVAAADYYRYKNNYKQALGHMKLAIKAAPKQARLYLHTAELLREKGMNEDSLRYFNKAIKLEPYNPNCYFAKLNLPDVTLSKREIESVEKLLGTPDLNLHFRSLLYFALANHYRRRNKLDAEMRALASANRCKQKELRYEPYKDRSKDPELIRQCFTAERIAANQLNNGTTKSPVFIVGFPRSGSTLLEQMLCTLPDMCSAGESAALQTAEAQALGNIAVSAPYPEWFTNTSQQVLQKIRDNYEHLQRHYRTEKLLVDKSLENYYRIGLIKTLFPDARILHTFKDPIDCALGCYRQVFQKSSWACIYDLDHLAIIYRRYYELMQYWDELFPGGIHHVSYEKLVTEPELTTREITAYCGVEWQAEMYQLEKSKSAVRTASASQIRQKLHSGELGRWKKYEKHLQPLLELENLPPFTN